MRSSVLSAAILLLALSACDGGKQNAADERKTAAGEVLGGSISDDMLPLATVQSQSPPLREGAGEEGDEATEDQPNPSGKASATPPAPESTGEAPAAQASATASPPAAQP